jgi:hypothetical protein
MSKLFKFIFYIVRTLLGISFEKKRRQPMEATRKSRADFNIVFEGEVWWIDFKWFTLSGDPAWFEGHTNRGNPEMRVTRIFSPAEIDLAQENFSLRVI